MKLRQIGAAALFAVLSSGTVRANVIYDFAGIAQTGSPITGVLTLSDAYVPGAPLAETAPPGVFISYTQSITGFADLTYTSADDYAVVAGAADPFTGHTAAGDGPLPSVPGIPKFADVYVINFNVPGGLNDYTFGAGVFIAFNDAGVTTVHGTDGKWTLQAAVPEPATLALLSLAFVAMGFARRRKLN